MNCVRMYWPFSPWNSSSWNVSDFKPSSKCRKMQSGILKRKQEFKINLKHTTYMYWLTWSLIYKLTVQWLLSIPETVHGKVFFSHTVGFNPQFKKTHRMILFCGPQTTKVEMSMKKIFTSLATATRRNVGTQNRQAEQFQRKYFPSTWL